MNNQTSTDPGDKSAAEIEREVQRSRAEVEQTLDQIQDRLSPGQLFDQAVTYLRDGGGGDFARNLGASVRDNPMPIALVALGVGWMMFSGQRSHHDADRYSRTYWDDDDIGEPYGGLADAGGAYLGTQAERDAGSYGTTGTGTTGTYGTTGDKATGLGDKAKDAGRSISDGAKGAGRAVGDKLGAMGEQARELGDRARNASDQARERVGRAGSHVADRAYEAGERARRQGRRARQSVMQSFQDQPLVLGAIGLAIGAALGAALPPTETEDRLMGDTRDEAVRRAAKVGREQAEKVRAGADAVVSAVREETGKQVKSEQAGESAGSKPGTSSTSPTSTASTSTPGQTNVDRPGDRPGAV